MIALSKSHILLLAAAVIVAGGTIAVVMQQRRAAPPAASPSVAQPAPTQRDATSPALAAVQAETKSIVAALGAPPPPEAKDGVPTFDIARIEASGDAVIAGRAAPGASVELLRNGEVHDRAVANAEGQFAMVPPRLPAGNYDLTLRADKAADGKPATSKQSVAVALAPNTNDRPVVALMTPDKPTVVLSQPGAAKNAGAIVVEAVEVQGTGKLHVSGRARPGASARFYLNDSFVAAATAGADGRFAITINEGVAPGNYRVRLDEVEGPSGAVRARAEVPFTVPAASAVAAAPAARATTEVAAAKPQPPAVAIIAPSLAPAAQAATEVAATKSQPPAVATVAPAPAAKSASDAAAARPQPPALAAAAPAPAAPPPSNVVVPKITTATVVPGDSLWSISQLTYGHGIRYAVIYEANQKQIRDPDLIYPGQIFVLPAQ